MAAKRCDRSGYYEEVELGIRFTICDSCVWQLKANADSPCVKCHRNEDAVPSQFQLKHIDETQKIIITNTPGDAQDRTSVDTNKFSHDRWKLLVEDSYEHIRTLAQKKGGEYSGDQDRLLNFRRNGLALDLPMETIWAVYAAKHWDALMQYIKDKQMGKVRERLEPISGRVDDLLVYLLLFKAMLDEKS